MGTRVDVIVESVKDTYGEGRFHRRLDLFSCHPTNFASFCSWVSVASGRAAAEDEGDDSMIQVLVDAGESCPKEQARNPLPASAKARHTVAARSGCPAAECWCRGNGPARPCPTIAPIAKNLFGNFSPAPESTNPTAIATTYSSTKSILETATHRLVTNSSCAPSLNASRGEPNTTKRLSLPDH